MSNPLVAKVYRFLIAEDGTTAVEYAVMLGLIVAMMISAITYVAIETREISDEIVEGMGSTLNEEWDQP